MNCVHDKFWLVFVGNSLMVYNAWVTACGTSGMEQLRADGRRQLAQWMVRRSGLVYDDGVYRLADPPEDISGWLGHFYNCFDSRHRQKLVRARDVAGTFLRIVLDDARLLAADATADDPIRVDRVAMDRFLDGHSELAINGVY